jgi:hypothetical protein
LTHPRGLTRGSPAATSYKRSPVHSDSFVVAPSSSDHQEIRLRALLLVLRLSAMACVAAASTHVLLGVGAERLLDPSLPAAIERLATLDSQNRFYGAAFAIYGVLLWLCATDLPRYAGVLRALLAVFFVAGLARVLSVAIVGWPSPAVVALGVIELVAPPLLHAWLSRAMRAPG